MNLSVLNLSVLNLSVRGLFSLSVAKHSRH
ncbi:hypothetical protein GGQ00_003270 [Salinibacter ruber]|nr:hypothetical protein [Salinibacter ruber]